MKQTTPLYEKPPSLSLPTHFGLNVVILDDETVKSPIELLKPIEYYTNLTLRRKTPSKPVSMVDVHQALNLSKMTELRSFKLQNITFIDDDDENSLQKLEATIASWPHISKVSLSGVFTWSHSYQSARRILAALARKSIEELQFHDNNIQNWDVNNWTVLQSTISSLKRFSFQALDSMSERDIISLSKSLLSAKQLVSCEIKINAITTAQLTGIVDCLKGSQLHVLELGTFDLTNAGHIEIIKTILTSFPTVKSLGLKVERWNSQLADAVFNIIAKHGQHLNQLIIQSSDVQYLIKSMAQSVSQTQLLDVRFVNTHGVDRTPEDVIELSRTRTNDVARLLYEKKETLDEYILELEELISKLSLNEGSVAFLPHQIDGILNIYSGLIKLDENILVTLNQFLAKLSCVIKEGRVPFEFIQYVFSTNVYPPHITLPLYPAVMIACQSSEEIQANLRPHFMSIIGHQLHLSKKMTSVRENFIGMESSLIEKSYAELEQVEALLSDPLYFPLLKSVERYGYLLAINSLKDEFSTNLNRRRDHVERFVKSHGQEFLYSTDLQQFTMFMTCNVPILARLAVVDESRANNLFQVLLSEIKSVDFLFEASNIITHLKSHTPTIPEQLFLLKLSLACQRVAIIRGFEDKEKQFERCFNEFQRTMNKNATLCLSDVDQLIEKLFKEKVAENVPAFLKEQIEAERTAVPQRVSLSHLLRTKPEDQNSAKSVSLKGYLRPQGVPLSQFFDGQKKDDESDSQGARVNDGPN